MSLPYSQKTAELLERMCRNVERKDFILEKEKAEELILKTYDLFSLDRPKKIKWCVDILDGKFTGAAWAARAAWAAGAAGAAGAAWAARAARAAWAAGAARAALDYDFDWYIFAFEYCQNPDKDKLPNENDKIYLEYCELLMQAKEMGLGYRVEWEDTLYLVPTPLVLIDSKNRFHSKEKPSILWVDGAKFYYLHGVKFEKEQWTKFINGQLSALEIITEPNQDKKRVMIMECKNEWLINELRAEIVSEELDDIGNPMRILKIPRQDDRPLIYYEGVDPTKKEKIYLRVHPDMEKEKPSMAKLWTWEYLWTTVQEIKKPIPFERMT